MVLGDPGDPLGGAPGSLLDMSISPDGRHAATLMSRAGPDPFRLTLWDLSAGPPDRPTARVAVVGNPSRMAFAPSGSRLALGHDSGFNVLSVPDLRTLTATSVNTATAVRYSPDDSILAVGTLSRSLQLWGQKSHRELATLRLPPGSFGIQRIEFGGDGRVLAAATHDSISLRDLAGAGERLALTGHAGGVPALCFSPDGSSLASAGKDRAVRLWDPATGRPSRTLDYPADVQVCRFSPDGTMLATGSDADARVRVWETGRWTEIHSSTGPGPDASISGLEFSRDGAMMAASGDKLRLWRVARDPGGHATFDQVFEKPTHRGLCVALSHDGRYAAYVVDDIHVKVWDITRGRDVPFAGPDLMTGWFALAFRSARELVYVAVSGQAQIWDVAEGRKLRAIGPPGTFQGSGAYVSPDGRWLASIGTAESVTIADLERGEVAFSFRDERNPIWSLAWSADARRLAVGLSDGGVSVWDLHEVHRLLAELGFR